MDGWYAFKGFIALFGVGIIVFTVIHNLIHGDRSDHHNALMLVVVGAILVVCSQLAGNGVGGKVVEWLAFTVTFFAVWPFIYYFTMVYFADSNIPHPAQVSDQSGYVSGTQFDNEGARVACRAMFDNVTNGGGYTGDYPTQISGPSRIADHRERPVRLGNSQRELIMVCHGTGRWTQTGQRPTTVRLTADLYGDNRSLSATKDPR